MTIDELEAFVTVARTSNIGAAAKRLGAGGKTRTRFVRYSRGPRRYDPRRASVPGLLPYVRLRPLESGNAAITINKRMTGGRRTRTRDRAISDRLASVPRVVSCLRPTGNRALPQK